MHRCSTQPSHVALKHLGLAALLMLVGGLTFGCAAPTASRGVETGGPQSPADTADVSTTTLPPGAIWLETLNLDGIEQSWGSPRAGLSVDGHPLVIAGRLYPHGVGTHAHSELIIDLNGSAKEFRAVAGVDGEVRELGSVVFVVRVDGQEVQRTPVLRGAGPSSTDITVDLTDAQRMTLIVEDAGDHIHYDHADWADAMLVLCEGTTQIPTAFVPDPGPPPRIVRDISPKPMIHAPRITGATPGRPFLFRIPATGARPLRFAAENLPRGLRLDEETGIISGTLETAGAVDVTLTVTGLHGVTSSTLTIVGGEHCLALTPPMGWNSWNVWGTAVDDAKVRAAADWMVRSGLAAHGYQYINIDDAWEAERDADGRIQSNEKFPDMRALADYVHSKGLKLGIYSSPGPKTCAGFAGSYEHEYLDAETYADWGIDLIKYDWCSYGGIALDDSEAELRKPYELMRAALDACGRDIVYSLCQYGMGQVWTWGADVGGNYWRTTGDITDTWTSLARIGFGQAELAEFAEPGHWNDPDMLVVGMVGWGPDLHASRLTHNEQVTHITLWSLLAAPLLVGCDLSQLDEFTLALLTNTEVLEVNQDPLGQQARRVAVDDQREVWMRPLVDGTLAVGLFNRGRGETTVAARWEDLGLSGSQRVRDLWQRRDVGAYEDAYSTPVSGHGAVMLKIGEPAGD